VIAGFVEVEAVRRRVFGCAWRALDRGTSPGTQSSRAIGLAPMPMLSRKAVMRLAGARQAERQAEGRREGHFYPPGLILAATEREEARRRARTSKSRKRQYGTPRAPREICSKMIMVRCKIRLQCSVGGRSPSKVVGLPWQHGATYSSRQDI
jgi:hypothetical protein